ncbi:hypothetical protein BJX63DRAFT_444437 [Aspergillus granulosus]|uniref:Uncharacterized protein n=1 Tax=Aspergillus granulosus TaxID=176169 RepID=A0ABR4H6J0_9EURO
MAEVYYRLAHWDPVEDPQPEKEPDIVPFSPRPRVLLSIYQWLRRYYNYDHLNYFPNCRRLDDMPLVDAAALDYIWPREEKNLYQPEAGAFWPTVLDDPPKDLWMDREKDGSTTRASSVTISEELPQNIPVDIDGAIDDLLVLTQKPAEPPLEKTAIGNLQMLAKFPKKLRQRLEEAPDRLGPSKISSHVLRVAYAGRSHLNWVALQNLPPRVIAAAVASNELRGASALSLCVDQFELREDDRGGGLHDFAVALVQCTGLEQLCLLQGPDRDSDNASACFYSQLLLLLWQQRALEGGRDLEWLRGKTIYLTCAFSTSLRSRGYLTSSSTISRSLADPDAQVVPVIHMFRFVDHQGEDGPDVAADDVQQYSNYYAMDYTLLDAEGFAVQFLAYLRSLGSSSDPEKAILRFAHKGSSSSSPGHSSVSPISAGFFDYELPPNDPSRVRFGDLQPGSWVVLEDSSTQICNHKTVEKRRPGGPEAYPPPSWGHPSPPPPPAKSFLNPAPADLSDPTQPSASTDRRGRSSNSNDNDTVIADNGPFLHYSFVKIPHISADIDIAHEKQQQRPLPIANPPEVVGGLTDFLRETAPGTDIATWEKQVEEVERDIRTGRASVGFGTGNRSIDIGVIAKSRAQALLNQLL